MKTIKVEAEILSKMNHTGIVGYIDSFEEDNSFFLVEKYVEGEADVVDMEKIINEFAMLRNQWLGIIKGLDIKGFQINNVIKLKVAGQEDFKL